MSNLSPIPNCSSNTASYTGHGLVRALEDRWIAASALQKAIRRNDSLLASQAAVALGLQSHPFLWRRFVVIAFEDVGSPEAIQTAVEKSIDRSGSEDRAEAALALAQYFTERSKDRTADHLIGIALHHPSLAEARREMASLPVHEKITTVASSRSLPQRAAAILSLVTFEAGGRRRFVSRGLSAVEYAYRALRGIPNSLTSASIRATQLIRDPIALLAPIIVSEIEVSGGGFRASAEIPPSPSMGGLPLYVFDKHTRLGKAAIRRFATQNNQVAACLAAYVSPRHRVKAAETACFHADAAPVQPRFVWRDAEHLAKLGAESDLFRDGVPIEGAKPLLDAVTANLDHLNAIRGELFRRWLVNACT